MADLLRICAWCDTDGAVTASAHRNGHDVTHGMCEAHIAQWERDAAGRVVAPKQQELAARPDGPWTQNGGK